MFLLTVKLVKNSHIYASISFVFPKNVLKQTLIFINTKVQLHWKDCKSSSQVSNILGLFYHLIALSLG